MVSQVIPDPVKLTTRTYRHTCHNVTTCRKLQSPEKAAAPEELNCPDCLRCCGQLGLPLAPELTYPIAVALVITDIGFLPWSRDQWLSRNFQVSNPSWGLTAEAPSLIA